MTRVVRKLFELACWLAEPMVPARMLEDRLKRQRRTYERQIERMLAEHAAHAAHVARLRREVARLEARR